MKITIISVGKLKEDYLHMALNEYSKRLGKYVKLKLIEVLDEKTTEKMSVAEENIIKQKEGQRILSNIKSGMYLIGLCIGGKQLSSENLAKFLQTNMTNNINNIAFIIGGSIGLSDEVLEKVDYKLSFSNMTFPHQLIRIILLEQIYRSYKIINNEPYHK